MELFDKSITVSLHFSSSNLNNYLLICWYYFRMWAVEGVKIPDQIDQTKLSFLSDTLKHVCCMQAVYYVYHYVLFWFFNWIEQQLNSNCMENWEYFNGGEEGWLWYVCQFLIFVFFLHLFQTPEFFLNKWNKSKYYSIETSK